MKYKFETAQQYDPKIVDQVKSKIYFLSNKIQSIIWDKNGNLIIDVCGPLEKPEIICQEIKNIIREEIENENSYNKVPLRNSDFLTLGKENINLSEFGYYLMEDQGQVRLSGHALQVFNELDVVFRSIAFTEDAEERQFTNLIQNDVLKKCNYLNHFPQNIGVLLQVKHDNNALDYISSTQNLILSEDIFEFSGFCLTPALCYHVFEMWKDCKIRSNLKIITCQGRCFRHEHKNLLNEYRLIDFTMREIVFAGNKENVQYLRNKLMNKVWEVFISLELSGGIYVANDPFFTSKATKVVGAIQRANELKYELRFIGNNTSFALSSFNLHNNHYGSSFNISLMDEDFFSGCIGFGLERWVNAFINTHKGQKTPFQLINTKYLKNI